MEHIYIYYITRKGASENIWTRAMSYLRQMLVRSLKRMKYDLIETEIMSWQFASSYIISLFSLIRKKVEDHFKNRILL